MSLLRRTVIARRGVRGLSTTTPVRHTAPLRLQKDEVEQRPGASYTLAASPLLLTTYEKPMNFGELQFSVAKQIDFLIERLCETDAGPWILNGILYYTLARMAAYYFLMQPAYLRHFQERYGQSWKVGHHLYGSTLPNPLKK
jgi:hypothetical protein